MNEHYKAIKAHADAIQTEVTNIQHQRLTRTRQSASRIIDHASHLAQKAHEWDKQLKSPTSMHRTRMDEIRADLSGNNRIDAKLHIDAIRMLVSKIREELTIMLEDKSTYKKKVALNMIYLASLVTQQALVLNEASQPCK